jgi:hypothetical protein
MKGFMNAVIQSLSNNEDFRYFFITSLIPANSKDVMINKQSFTRTTTVECLRTLKQRTTPQLEQMYEWSIEYLLF